MTPRRTMINNLAVSTVAFIILFNIFSVLAHMSHNYVGLLHLLLAVPFYFLCWLRRAGSSRVYFWGIIWVTAATLAVGNLAYGGSVISLASAETVFVFMGLVIIRFVIVRIKDREADLSISTAVYLLIVHVGLFIFVHFYGAYNSILLIQLPLTSLFVLLLCLLCAHFNNIEYRMAIMQAVENYHQPVGKSKVFAANNRMIAVFMVVALCISALLAFLPVGLYRLVDSRLRAGRLPDTGFVYIHMGWDVDEVSGEVQAQVQEEGELVYEIVLANPGAPQNIVTVIFLAAGALIIGAILYVAIVLGNRPAKQRRDKSKNSGEDAITVLGTSLLDDLLGLLPRGRLFLHPVRRAYVKKVNKHIRKGMYVTSSDTTGIIGNKIRPSENIDELTATYEKVRYGRGKGE